MVVTTREPPALGLRLRAVVLLAICCWTLVGLAEVVEAWPRAADVCFMGCAVEPGEVCCCLGGGDAAQHASDHHTAEQVPNSWWQARALACQDRWIGAASGSSLPEPLLSRDYRLRPKPQISARAASFALARLRQRLLVLCAPRPPPTSG